MHFFAETMKRRVSPPKPFHQRTSLAYAIFYLPEENKYMVLSTASTLFPKGVDLDSLVPLTEIELRDRFSSFPALYVQHSSSKDEIDVTQVRLQRFIDSGKLINKESSLKFLQESFHEECSSQETSIVESSPPSPINVTQADISDNPNNESDELSEDLPQPSNFDIMLSNRKLSTIIENQNRSFKTLTSLSTELSKCRKILSRAFSKKYTAEVKTTIDIAAQSCIETDRPKVLYMGKDLVSEGRRNLELTHYSLRIARILWNDDELLEMRLLPKSNSVLPLSPGRTELFLKAIRARFNITDDDELEPAIRAVNQLCIDLKRGRRKRSAMEPRGTQI